MMWTIVEVQGLVDLTEIELAKVGWHVGLTGSCLHQGRWGRSSDHDVDLVIYPHKKARGSRCPNKATMRGALKRCGLHQVRSRSWLQKKWRERGVKPVDDKWIEVWATADGKRIDVMVLS